VAVEIEGAPDAAVPQPLTCDLRMDARGKHVAGVCVTKIVKALAGQGALDDPQTPFLTDGIRIVWTAVRLRDNKRASIQPHADAQHGFRLARPVRPQFSQDCG
jgi:hypothetical protein